MRHRAVAAVAVLVVLFGAGLAAGGGVEISAAGMEVDGNTGRLMARGRVRVSDGIRTLTGELLIANLRTGLGVLRAGQVRIPEGVMQGARVELAFTQARITRIAAQGDASFETRRGVIFADRVEVGLSSGRLTATGSVRVFVPPDVVAFGSRLVYGRPTGQIRMEGPVRLQSAQGLVTGDVLEGSEGLQWVVMRGGVRIESADLRGRADIARLFARERRVVLEGRVFVQRSRQSMWADRVTVFYGTRRVVVEGLQRLLIEEEHQETD
ncbi:MAG: hypothetical protein QN194_13805 [Armatimonadota bacterium]|nr:hypothetical protein [Armatimonadota bacterium]